MWARPRMPFYFDGAFGSGLQSSLAIRQPATLLTNTGLPHSTLGQDDDIITMCAPGLAYSIVDMASRITNKPFPSSIVMPNAQGEMMLVFVFGTDPRIFCN